MAEIQEAVPEPASSDRPTYGAMEDRVYDGYQDQRNRLLDGEQELGRSFDKYLLTLGGGALGLSLTFPDDLVTPGEVQVG